MPSEKKTGTEKKRKKEATKLKSNKKKIYWNLAIQ
jgi:hypothetical protein